MEQGLGLMNESLEFDSHLGQHSFFFASSSSFSPLSPDSSPPPFLTLPLNHTMEITSVEFPQVVASHNNYGCYNLDYLHVGGFVYSRIAEIVRGMESEGDTDVIYFPGLSEETVFPRM